MTTINFASASGLLEEHLVSAEGAVFNLSLGQSSRISDYQNASAEGATHSQGSIKSNEMRRRAGNEMRLCCKQIKPFAVGEKG
ncbi:MAG TPA: hypothetical protein VFX07_01035 [Candidatus Udaeobacter sp.]|jgi:hypothetical protein|nr:hypothetical protein [Candidatus Udaeobacter sp.]